MSMDYQDYKQVPEVKMSDEYPPDTKFQHNDAPAGQPSMSRTVKILAAVGVIVLAIALTLTLVFVFVDFDKDEPLEFRDAVLQDTSGVVTVWSIDGQQLIWDTNFMDSTSQQFQDLKDKISPPLIQGCNDVNDFFCTLLNLTFPTSTEMGVVAFFTLVTEAGIPIGRLLERVHETFQAASVDIRELGIFPLPYEPESCPVEGQVFLSCASVCNATCNNPNPICIEICKINGCNCPHMKPIVHNGECIEFASCPVELVVQDISGLAGVQSIDGQQVNWEVNLADTTSQQYQDLKNQITPHLTKGCEDVTLPCTLLNMTFATFTGSDVVMYFTLRIEEGSPVGTFMESLRNALVANNVQTRRLGIFPGQHESCPVEGQVMELCGSSCNATCENPDPICGSVCIENGCGCPENKPMSHNGHCIDRDSCP